MNAVERCLEHMVADGQIERSIKKGGMVERTRRCGECGSLFKTTEITDEMMADIEREHNAMVNELGRELKFYGKVFTDTKAIFEAVRTLSDDLRGDFEFGDEEKE